MSKGDLEYLETIVTLIEEIKEDELNLPDYSLKIGLIDLRRLKSNFFIIGNDQDVKQEKTLNIQNPRRSKLAGTRWTSQGNFFSFFI